jgi:signal transduction histidine kinase
MDRLLTDLLEFSRVGRVALDVAPLEVTALVEEVLELASPPPQFRIVRQISAAALETASLPLRRVLLNLVGNAIKHHDQAEGQILIRVEDQGPRVIFEVSDDGPGIPPQYHGKIFEMFQTLRSRDEVEGSGIGLSLVKKIVDNAGGNVAVESSGRGSTFRVAWPRIWPSPRK